MDNLLPDEQGPTEALANLTPREKAGKFLLHKGHYMGDRISAGRVQDYLEELYSQLTLTESALRAQQQSNREFAAEQLEIAAKVYHNTATSRFTGVHIATSLESRAAELRAQEPAPPKAVTIL